MKVILILNPLFGHIDMEKAKLFAFFVERENERGECLKILLDSWDSVCDCLSHLSGVDSYVHIYRMPICSKND